MTASVFGTFTSRGEVNQAVITTLQTWILTYLAETERQEGLPPRTILPPGGSFPPSGGEYPATNPSFRSGLDFETWQGDTLPLLIVVAQPAGEPERYEAGRYSQWYEVQVGAVCEDPDGQEWVVQQLADRYGKAIMALLSQQGGVGTRVDESGVTVPFAEKSVMVASPKTEFVDPASRRFARSVVAMHVMVESLVDESQGPRVPPADPYALPGQWPTITQVDVQLESQTPAGVTVPASGAAVTTSVGAGAVTIQE